MIRVDLEGTAARDIAEGLRGVLSTAGPLPEGYDPKSYFEGRTEYTEQLARGLAAALRLLREPRS